MSREQPCCFLQQKQLPFKDGPYVFHKDSFVKTPLLVANCGVCYFWWVCFQAFLYLHLGVLFLRGWTTKHAGVLSFLTLGFKPTFKPWGVNVHIYIYIFIYLFRTTIVYLGLASSTLEQVFFLWEWDPRLRLDPTKMAKRVLLFSLSKQQGYPQKWALSPAKCAKMSSARPRFPLEPTGENNKPS